MEPVDSQNLPLVTLEMFDQIAVAIFLTDRVGNILAVTRSAASLLGYAQEDLVGKNIGAFTHADDAAQGKSPGVVSSGRTLGARRRWRHKDGQLRVADEAAWVLDDGCIVSVISDVTAPVEAERALHENVERLRVVINAVPALVGYVDTNTRYVWANESYRRWFGYPPDKIRGLLVSEVLGASAWATIRPYAERALAGEEVTFGHRLAYKSGPARDIRASYVPDRGPDGRVRGFVVLSNDITEIKASEVALRRSEHLLEQSQSTARVGSWELVLASEEAAEIGSLRWSDETYRLFGYEPRSIEVTYQVFIGAVHPEDRDAVRTVSSAGILRGEPFEKEYRIVRPDGTVRLVHAWSRFEQDATGKPRRMLGTCQDITERKQAEEEIRRAREEREAVIQELRHADRRKDEFLAMLSHELRNPLAPILSAVEMLDRIGPDEVERTSRYRTVIARQVQHMKRLLDDLLDVARVSQGKIQLRTEPVELGALLLQAVEVSRPMIVEKRQEFSMTLAPEPVRLDADPTRIVQVFANLINNAAKYTGPGGHIALTVTAEDGEAVVRVRDDGMGMRPEILTRAFDLFVQETRSLDRAQGGLGIGLTMVKTLVKMHGGSVRAISDGPGRGSEFVVRLPLLPPPPMLSPRDAPPSTKRPRRSLRVLVVDDNTDAADALGHLLEALGHQVRLAYDGPSALAAAAVVAPEVVLLDIGLPGMDGYTVAARLRGAGHEGAALIAITGYGQDEHQRRSSEAGFDHHLVKPVALAALREIIDQATRRFAGETR